MDTRSFLFSHISGFLDPYQRSREKLIRKLIGGDMAVDALLFRPTGIISRIKIQELSKDMIGKYVTTTITPISLSTSSRYAKTPIKIHALCSEKRVEVVFFNSKYAYIKKMLEDGKKLYVSGKLTLSSEDVFQFVHPDYVGTSTRPRELEETSGTYSLTTGINQRFVFHIIENIIHQFRQVEISEWIEEPILKNRNWSSFKDSIIDIHYPKDETSLSLANKSIQRLLFDEILAEQIAMKICSHDDSLNTIFPMKDGDLFHNVVDSLPFEMTEDQRLAVENIEKEMNSNKPMRMLLQGDVGSGKTIVAILSSVKLIDSGYQCAFLAPTEILARQHFHACQKYLSKFGVDVDILTSYEKGERRKEILENIKSGKSKIIIGTHAIFGNCVEFKNLGFIVVDEQHRFGVNQRLMLIEKGINPHILSMTATPIPRTLILSHYGDISVSYIRTKPSGRKDIITSSSPISKMSDIIKSIDRVRKTGKKIYWVCPLIEESEKMDYTCVINRFEYIKKYFGDDVSMMHGKMKQNEKSEIFERFKSGTTHILVSTTIIEVGVDVPDATIIVIENAEKFGLSQLHQLRGRVGRSDAQSYCVLLFDDEISKVAKERIKTIKNSGDGFEIARKDLVLRGAGEILGTKQSGLKKSRFYNSDDYANFETIISNIMEEAVKFASKIVKSGRIREFDVILKVFQQENFESVKKSF